MAKEFDHTQLKKLREFLKWTLRNLMVKLSTMGFDVTEQTLLNWENGDTTPDADKLPVLAAVFGVGIERFYPEK